MKKKENIRTLLGISQENLAQILKVSRSQIAMYEIGRRNLPIHAVEILSEMLIVLQNTSHNNINVNFSNTFEKEFLQMLILKNEHQQHIVEKKINAILKKQKTLTSSKKLITYLIKKNSDARENELDILKSIAVTTDNKIAQNNSNVILKLQVKKEVLKFEEKFLKEKIKTYSNDTSLKE